MIVLGIVLGSIAAYIGIGALFVRVRALEINEVLEHSSAHRKTCTGHPGRWVCHERWWFKDAPRNQINVAASFEFVMRWYLWVWPLFGLVWALSVLSDLATSVGVRKVAAVKKKRTAARDAKKEQIQFVTLTLESDQLAAETRSYLEEHRASLRAELKELPA